MSWLLRHCFADAATAKAVMVSATIHLIGFGVLVAFGPNLETVRQAPRGDVVVSLFLKPSESEDLTMEIYVEPQAEQPSVLVTPDRVRVAQRWYTPVPSQIDPPDIDQLQVTETPVPEQILETVDEVVDDAVTPLEEAAESDAEVKPQSETPQTQPASNPATADTAGYGDQPPQFTYQPSPVYPSVARSRRLQGSVLLELEINVEGRVTAVRVLRSSNFTELDGAAVTAVQNWRCVPCHRGGVPVASSETLPVHFRLR